MKTNSAAFTLIELLVVITIIAILASFALPAYTTVQERASQTKDLSNGKQIALALKQFATDNNGAFPSKAPAADYSSATDLVATNKSNDAFWWLFPNYLQSEDIFVVAGSKWTPGNPDNKVDAAGAAARGDTLKLGENNYAYVVGLTDTANPAFPLLADGFKDGAIPTYDANKGVKGGVWAAKRAIVVFCDTSGQIMKVDPTSKTVNRPGHNTSIFAAGSSGDPWIESPLFVINPE